MSWAEKKTKNKKRLWRACVSLCLLIFNETLQINAKSRKSSVFLLFCGSKHNWRLQVSVSISPVPVFIFWDTDDIKWIHMEENFCSHNKCLSLLVRDHASFWHEIWHPLRAVHVALVWEWENILFLHPVSNIFRKLLQLIEQYACQRMSRNLFQNKMSCASLGFLVNALMMLL